MEKPAVSSQGPDYFMSDTVSTVLDKAGQPKRRLETAYLAHFPEDNRTELQQARLTLHQDDGSLWSIKANRGTLYQETEQIYLTGDVIIEKPPTDASRPGVKIQTDKLHVDPKQQIAETDDAVLISSEDARVNAVGMKANLQTKSVELLANVRGIYAPRP